MRRITNQTRSERRAFRERRNREIFNETLRDWEDQLEYWRTKLTRRDSENSFVRRIIKSYESEDKFRECLRKALRNEGRNYRRCKRGCDYCINNRLHQEFKERHKTDFELLDELGIRSEVWYPTDKVYGC